MKNFKIEENKEKGIIPLNYKKYFWDCNFESLSLEKYWFFIIERILRYGDINSVKWLLKNVSIEQLHQTLKKSKNLDKKTFNFWKLITL